MCSHTGADLNIFAPSLGITMETEVIIDIPAGDLVLPESGELQTEVLGQPDTKVKATVENGNVKLAIPADAWAKATEYMPVIRVRGVVAK